MGILGISIIILSPPLKISQPHLMVPSSNNFNPPLLNHGYGVVKHWGEGIIEWGLMGI